MRSARCGLVANPALWGPGDWPPQLPVLHHPGAQHRPQELQDRLIADAFLHRLHQLIMRNRRKGLPALLRASMTSRRRSGCGRRAGCPPRRPLSC